MACAIGARRSADHALPRLDLRARIIRTKARQRAVNQTRIRFCHGHGAQTQALHHARTEVLDHHVGAGDKLLRRLAIRIVFEIQHNAALVTVPRGIGRRIPARPARWINTYHIRTMVTQQHRRHGACDVLSKIDNAYAFQNA